MNKAKGPSSRIVDNCIDIANSFSCRYDKLFSSVPSDPQSVLSIISCECVNNTCSNDSTHCHNINVIIVKSAINSLRAGKIDGVDKVFSHNCIHGSECLFIYISYIFRY